MKFATREPGFFEVYTMIAFDILKQPIIAIPLLAGLSFAYRHEIGDAIHRERPAISLEKKMYYTDKYNGSAGGVLNIKGTVRSREGRNIEKISLCDDSGNKSNCKIDSEKASFFVEMKVRPHYTTSYYIETEDEEGNKNKRYLGKGYVYPREWAASGEK